MIYSFTGKRPLWLMSHIKDIEKTGVLARLMAA
jgi:hypothetical protein